MVLNLLLSKIFEFPSEHPTHQIPFKRVDISASELLHHLLDLSIGDEADERVAIFHESHRIIGVIVGV